jgi:hypothetical protein
MPPIMDFQKLPLLPVLRPTVISQAILTLFFLNALVTTLLAKTEAILLNNRFCANKKAEKASKHGKLEFAKTYITNAYSKYQPGRYYIGKLRKNPQSNYIYSH